MLRRWLCVALTILLTICIAAAGLAESGSPGDFASGARNRLNGLKQSDEGEAAEQAPDEPAEEPAEEPADEAPEDPEERAEEALSDAIDEFEAAIRDAGAVTLAPSEPPEEAFPWPQALEGKAIRAELHTDSADWTLTAQSAGAALDLCLEGARPQPVHAQLDSEAVYLDFGSGTVYRAGYEDLAQLLGLMPQEEAGGKRVNVDTRLLYDDLCRLAEVLDEASAELPALYEVTEIPGGTNLHIAIDAERELAVLKALADWIEPRYDELREEMPTLFEALGALLPDADLSTPDWLYDDASGDEETPEPELTLDIVRAGRVTTVDAAMSSGVEMVMLNAVSKRLPDGFETSGTYSFVGFDGIASQVLFEASLSGGALDVSVEMPDYESYMRLKGTVLDGVVQANLEVGDIYGWHYQLVSGTLITLADGWRLNLSGGYSSIWSFSGTLRERGISALLLCGGHAYGAQITSDKPLSEVGSLQDLTALRVYHHLNGMQQFDLRLTDGALTWRDPDRTVYVLPSVSEDGRAFNLYATVGQPDASEPDAVLSAYSVWDDGGLTAQAELTVDGASSAVLHAETADADEIEPLCRSECVQVTGEMLDEFFGFNAWLKRAMMGLTFRFSFQLSSPPV